MPATSTKTKETKTEKKPRTRNRSPRSAGTGRTPMGASQTVKALMIAITWTQAQVVTITAIEDFDLKCVAVDTRNGNILAESLVKVYADTTLYFAKSSFDGLYYIGRVGAASQVACTCAGHSQFHMECKHESMILKAHNAKTQRACEREAAEFAQAVEALPAADPVEQEMPAECPQNDTEVSPDCSTEEALQTASPEQRRAIWKQTAKDERARKKAIGAEYWGKVADFHAQDVRKIG